MNNNIFKTVEIEDKKYINLLEMSKRYITNYNFSKEKVYNMFKDNKEIEKTVAFYEFFKEFLTEKERDLYLNEKQYVRNYQLIRNKFSKMINKEEEVKENV